ncbi:ABC-F family ATP-binding cassette domain-containing protein [Rossellomorea marisflavi]|uniref:Heme ABC transporter ATP-binding protein n=1 Tax=Rossellomorea marisflavi TaxID=189381 RepID=A0A0J5TLT8_9BACI|nr:ABC-F family ATP-binding cassette domain-containing protein [Rossellomorea marisflavi]VXB09897.1 putative energy-sensing inhibitor of translation [Bacillus sp. 349Y]KMK94375.1 heme ABC transporter ATP-binding protein [Rossellomorea marisflavi]KML08045.1 heme ABC transporter ATP-binding protein [Rossellomorea marisflavi]KML34204.1 heme ABC transporter ATP-binding protein [Rossellomorea marisflavi]KZE52899.1 heme ABC transporter ATP-binding protein [Rossellomorea marisflavi]
MSLLTVKNLTHGFGDRAIFNDVSFRLLKGEHIGLIGANGEGKSTFMNIITGKLEPDEGKVEWAKRIRIGYLDQHAQLKQGMTIRDVLKTAFQYLFDMETEMNELFGKMGDASPEELEDLLEETGTLQEALTNNDFYVIDAKVEEIGRGLGLDDIGLDKDVHDLSGGQRTKVLLAKLLLEKPDILLLDEPTNYLDEQHIEWLKRYLQEYENAFILISHDIPFLNSVINLIYHMENQELNRYAGDYHEFKKVHEMKRQQLESAYKKQQQEISNLKDFVARNKARVSTRNMAMSRQKKLDKMEVIELASEKPKPEFNFKLARTAGRVIFETKDLVIGYDEPLSRPLNLKMERGQKIALSGANGIGKTTLLRSILGEIKPISGSVELGEYLHIGYFEQEIKTENRNTCIEEVWNEFPSLNQAEVRAALAKCGLTTKHIESKVEVLSGGEKAKVRLCKLMNNESNVLVFDEPTNHLDVEAKEELKRALKEYKGSVLLISHEPDFYQDVATEVWNCESWTTKLF